MSTALDTPAFLEASTVNEPPRSTSVPLGERLLRAGIISADELEAALAEQESKQARLGEVLVRLGILEEEQLLPFLEQQIGITHVQLRDGMIDPKIVRTLPRSLAEEFTCLAMFRVRQTLTVAMADPQELSQIDRIEAVTGLRVRAVLAMRSAIEKLIPRAYEEGFEVDAVTADMDSDAVAIHDDAFHVELQDFESIADGSPVVNLVNYTILHAVRQGASDIHVEPGQRNTSIRFRVDGQLREVLRPRRELHPALISRIKVMGKMDIAEHRVPQDGRVHVVVDKRAIDLRVSTLPTILGEKAVIRVLDRANITFQLEELGMSSGALRNIKDMLAKPYGLFLVTGPTGSGKTTTLYSATELVKSVHRNIVTVEDPVEYQLELINQVQVNSASSLSFARVLRSILRQDPDVIMVGEIRDAETAEMAIQAALTGHLVLATLHTNDSASAVTRLVDMGIPPYKIATAFVGVVAQRLVRTVCPNCRTMYYPPADLLRTLHFDGNSDRQFVRGEGCHACYDTGFKGRTGIYEVLVGTHELRDVIGQEPDVQTIRHFHTKSGGTTLLQEGLALAEQGITSVEEVMRVSYFE